MSSAKRRIINTIAFTLVGVGLLFLAYRNIDLDKVWEDVKTAKPAWLLLSAVIGILSHYVRAVRWKLLLEPLGHRPRTTSSFYAVMIGYVANFAGPRLGEVLRPASLKKTDNIPLDHSIGTVISERLIDLIMTVLIATVIVFYQFDLIYNVVDDNILQPLKSKTWLLVGLMVVGVIGLVVLWLLRKQIGSSPFGRKAVQFVVGLKEGMRTILRMKQLGLFLFESVLIWVLYFLMSYVIFFSLEGTAHLGIQAGLTVLLLGTAAMIIPIPGGLGTFHYIVKEGLLLYAITESAAASYAAVAHGVQMIMIFVVGGICWFLASRSPMLDKSATNDIS
jgi:hypothetical protein